MRERKKNLIKSPTEEEFIRFCFRLGFTVSIEMATSSLVSAGAVCVRSHRSAFGVTRFAAGGLRHSGSCGGAVRLAGLRRTNLQGKQIQINRKASESRFSRSNELASTATVNPLAMIGQLQDATDRSQSGIWPDSLPSPGTPGTPGSPAERNTKGWTDDQGREDSRLVALIRNIAVAAQARAAMHADLGVQRDNWNKLCHSTVTMATVAAAALAAINTLTGAPAVSISVTAFLLNAGAGAMIFLANKLQPTKLAEQQRTAAHVYKTLAKEIEQELLLDPRLREDAHTYLENKLTKLNAFPNPLAPENLQNFPKVPSVNITMRDSSLSGPEMCANNSNGWSDEVVDSLKGVAELLRSSDIGFYQGLAQKKVKETARFVMLTQSFVVAAAVLNMLQFLPWQFPFPLLTTGLAGACSVAAMFTFSFSHGGQIGMILEMYENCIGAYVGMDQTIQKVIRTPVCQREDGELFHQKIALQLGRQNRLPLLQPEDKTAGAAF